MLRGVVLAAKFEALFPVDACGFTWDLCALRNSLGPGYLSIAITFGVGCFYLVMYSSGPSLVFGLPALSPPMISFNNSSKCSRRLNNRTELLCETAP